jgi:hypothetical protein
MCKSLHGVVKPIEAALRGTCSMHGEDQKCVSLNYFNWGGTTREIFVSYLGG